MLDLFSGIGGFSLAAKWVWGDDLDIVGFCEIESYAQKVLKKNFPGVPIYEDIKKLRGDEFHEIDLITGGFPCQDISSAGRGAGIKEGTRSGLWFELLRVIGDIRPRFALIENVPMLTVRGGTRVIADLADIGYNAEWTIISARDVGARHLRKRIWIVAYPRKERLSRKFSGTSGRKDILADSDSTRRRERRRAESVQETFNSSECDSEKVSNTTVKGLQRPIRKEYEGVRERPAKRSGDISDTNSRRLERSSQKERKTRYVVRGGRKGSQGDVSDSDSIGLSWGENNRSDGDLDNEGPSILCDERQTEWSNIWSVEPNVGRVANGVPSRVDRLKGLGNAIVPQVAALIMDRIKAID